MSLIKKIFLILGIVFPVIAYTNDKAKFSSPKITKEQWQIYFDEIKAINGVEPYELNQQIIIEDQGSSVIYVFTSLEHFAYPAVVIRKVAEKDGEVVIHMSGYFAGSQIEFDKWWKQFKELNDNLRNKMHSLKVEAGSI